GQFRVSPTHRRPQNNPAGTVSPWTRTPLARQPATGSAPAYDRSSPPGHRHGAIGAVAFFGPARTARVDLRRDRGRRLELAREVLVDVDLPDDSFELDELFDELLRRDGFPEEVLEAGPSHHDLLTVGGRGDVSVRPVEEGLSRVEEIGNGNPSPRAAG